MQLKVNNKLVISCDGGAASGKTTGGKLIAKKYKLNFLSSGIHYRYASYLFIKYKPKNQIYFLRKKIKNLNYKKLSKIYLHNENVNRLVSIIAKNNIVTIP